MAISLRPPERCRWCCWELVAALRGERSVLAGISDTEVVVARNPTTRVSWTLPSGKVVADAAHAGFATAYRVVRSRQPERPAPHLPSAVGTTDPYSHLCNMVVLHGAVGDNRVRLDDGDGR